MKLAFSSGTKEHLYTSYKLHVVIGKLNVRILGINLLLKSSSFSLNASVSFSYDLFMVRSKILLTWPLLAGSIHGKAMRYNVTTRTPWPIEGKRIQEKTRCKTAASKKTLKKMKKDAKANAPQTTAQTPNEKLKDPNLSSTCAEELWVEIGIFEFFIGHLCSSLWSVYFFIFFLIALKA